MPRSPRLLWLNSNAKFALDDRAVFNREESPDTAGQDGR